MHQLAAEPAAEEILQQPCGPDHAVEIDARLDPEYVEHVDEILGAYIAGRTRCEGAAPQARNRGFVARDVWVNTYRTVSYMMPFGGMKHSGIGRESGMDAIHEFLETKSVWLSYAKGAPANPFILR